MAVNPDLSDYLNGSRRYSTFPDGSWNNHLSISFQRQQKFERRKRLKEEHSGKTGKQKKKERSTNHRCSLIFTDGMRLPCTLSFTNPSMSSRPSKLLILFQSAFNSRRCRRHDNSNSRETMSTLIYTWRNAISHDSMIPHRSY